VNVVIITIFAFSDKHKIYCSDRANQLIGTMYEPIGSNRIEW